MPEANGSNKYYIGDYHESEGPYLNPIKTSDPASPDWKSSDNKFFNYIDTYQFEPGHIGDMLVYDHGLYTPQKGNGYSVIPSSEIFQAYNALKTYYTAYTAKAAAYETQRAAYDEAIKTEELRLEDNINRYFEDRIEIPVRPCPFPQPIAWWGPNFSLSNLSHWGHASDSEAVAMKAGLIQQSESFPLQQDPKFWQRDWAATFDKVSDYKKNTMSYGFMPHSNDDVSDSYKYAGKTFGILGSGYKSQPANTYGFRYDENTSKKHYMYVSVFPDKLN